MEDMIRIGEFPEQARFGEGSIVHTDVELFERIITMENLVAAWREFRRGKGRKRDVMAFADYAEERLVSLAHDLADGRYRHGQYTRFVVHDPKRREISKASVRDRVLHHAICRVIEPIFERGFIFDSYANRRGKGVLAASDRFDVFARRCSRNGKRAVFVLRADIRKYFDSVNHDILLSILARRIQDDRAMALISAVIRSFETFPGKGVPLGNLTSQLFSNAYLDPLDQFAKRELGIRYYLRYADDIAVLSDSVSDLVRIRDRLDVFLSRELSLSFHPDKTGITPLRRGVDFLGTVHFPTHRVLRTKTVRRALSRLSPSNATSYLGLTRHVRAHGLADRMRGILEKSER